MKHANFNLGRKFLATILLAVLTFTTVPASTVMAADSAPEVSVIPEEVADSYLQLTQNQVTPRSGTTYFIPDQQVSFVGTLSTYWFNIPSACQARLVIAPVGSEPLYIRVFNSQNVCERTLTATPNQAQVLVFNISAGDHYLEFYSATGSQFTVRLQMYTWDY